MSIKLSELAQKINCRLQGEDCLIDNVADINHATTGQLAFVSSVQYKDSLSSTKASAVITKEEWLDDCVVPVLLTKDPRLAFAKAATLLNPVIKSFRGIHPKSYVANDAVIASSAALDAFSVIKSGAKIGHNSSIGAGSIIGENVIIGDDVQINANVTIYSGCSVGNNSILHSGVIIGADGFGFVRDKDTYLKVPQLGGVRIGENVEIGSSTTIDRGALLDTIIGDNVKLDNQIQIGHNVEIGKHTVISACSCIGGGTKIGEFCLMGGNVGLRDNIEVTDNVIITARSFVTASIKKSGSYSSSTPLDETANWRKNAMRFKKLDELFKRFQKLERKLLPKD